MQSFLSLGRLHLPVFGLFAAVGLMAAMTIGLFTSRRAGIDPDRFWNLGAATVLAAFVLSRALLVIENLHTFLQYPVLVLELPSITSGGMFATAVVAVLYLRRLRLPLLRTLDAAAPCAALLECFLSLGRFADGTREGMPTALPWAVQSSFGRVHPVELYSALAWLGIALLLLAGRGARQSREGHPLAWGLMLGGLALFLLNFFKLPNQLYGSTMLDGYQWRGVEMMAAGALLLAWRFATEDRTAHDAGAASPLAPSSVKDLGDAV